MNNLPLLLIQSLTTGMTLELDHHPAGRRYIHLAYWLANRIGEGMNKPASTSAIWNIINKKERLVKTLQIIADTSNDDDSRLQAQQALQDIGVIAPPAAQPALPHMPPMPEDPPPLYGPFYHGPGDEVMSEPGFGTFGKPPVSMQPDDPGGEGERNGEEFAEWTNH